MEPAGIETIDQTHRRGGGMALPDVQTRGLLEPHESSPSKKENSKEGFL